MDKNRMNTAVENAETILAFSAEKGVDISEDSVKVIVNTRLKLDKNEELGELESQFWLVYASLARQIHPVTLESLRAIRLKPDFLTKGAFLRFFTSKSIAHESVNAYRILGMVVMIIMLLVQIYWVIGAKLVSDINTVLPERIEALLKQKTEREKYLGEQAATSIEIAHLEGRLEELGAKLTASSMAVEKWNNIWERIVPVSTDSAIYDLDISKDYLEIKYASFALDAMQEYVLPLLYGLLGAFAFVFRDIFIEIHNKTFTQEASIKYILRLHLGALTGLAVGWFFGDEGARASFSFSSLSPLALSFLGGYAVEILFSGMDRLISSFSDDKPTPLVGKRKLATKNPSVTTSE